MKTKTVLKILLVTLFFLGFSNGSPSATTISTSAVATGRTTDTGGDSGIAALDIFFVPVESVINSSKLGIKFIHNFLTIKSDVEILRYLGDESSNASDGFDAGPENRLSAHAPSDAPNRIPENIQFNVALSTFIQNLANSDNQITGFESIQLGTITNSPVGVVYCNAGSFNLPKRNDDGTEVIQAGAIPSTLLLLGTGLLGLAGVRINNRQ